MTTDDPRARCRARAHGLRTCTCGLALALALLAASGCGAATDEGELGTLTTQSGPFAGEITLDADPPEVGEHEAELTLERDGEPLHDATVEITPFMPAHGHGSMPVEARETAPGHYVAGQMSLFMPGLWELRVRVEDGGDQGRLVASFEVR